MKKSQYDTRNFLEVLEELKTQRTSTGDTITLIIKSNRNNRPFVSVKFDTSYPDLAHLPQVEDLTEFLPLSLDVYDREFSGWKAYLREFLLPYSEQRVTAGGRRFKVVQEES